LENASARPGPKILVRNSLSAIYRLAVKDLRMIPEAIKNPWTTLSGDVKYDNPWITVTEFQVINPSGGRGIYGKVHFKNKAIGIIPVDKELNTWLVGQYRYTLNAWHWEIPEGGGPLKEDPLASAQRELREETGLIAKSWSEIIHLHTSNSVTDEEGHIFLAEDLQEGSSELEATEADLKVWKLPLKEALDMVLAGKITDSMSVMAILKVARLKGI
jgi:8-oxo-dGTP pyrophosphatase MutT (NUDIX family)